MKYNYIIFHRGCRDGFSGFIILNRTNTIHPNAQIYPDVPSAKGIPPNIEGCDVIIIDVAYTYNILKEIISLAKSVTFIDHHITIHNDVQKLHNEPKLTILYDEQECGASLTWKFFHGSKKMPLFIRYIKDNDIGAWVLKNTEYFISALDVFYTLDLRHDTIRHWNALFETDEVKRLIRKGRTYWEYIQFQLDANVKKYSLELFPSEQIYALFPSHFEKPGQYRVAVFNTSTPNASLLGKEAMKKINCDFAIIWTFHMDHKNFVLSLRSAAVDVGSIAKLFNGGGHTHASAMSFPLSKYNITDLFFPTSQPRSNKN